MYKCDNCGRCTVPGEKQNKVILKQRNKTYYNTILDEKKQIVLEKDKTPKLKETQGTEIVVERNFCSKCHD